MPRLVVEVPRYRLHRASGQAVVTIGGHDHYLGPWKSKASRIAYDRLVGEWLARGRQPHVATAELTVVELLVRYCQHARTYYQRDGKPTGELSNIRHAVHPLRQLYGRTPVAEFGPLCLKAVRQKMIDRGLCRRVINARIHVIRRIFGWGVAEELVPPAVLQALAAVKGLKKGRANVRETKAVKPVPDEIIDLTLPHLPPVVADMVRLQRLTGVRPTEICILRPCDVDRQSAIWAYRPNMHKMDYKDQPRVVFLGPKAQAILEPYLERGPDAYCFSPAESETVRRREARARRKSKVQPSQVDRRRVRPKRKPRDRYYCDSYRTAIHRACDKAFGEERGPVTWGQLVELAKRRELKATDMVRSGKLGRWKRAAAVAGLVPARRQKPAAAQPDVEAEWCYKDAIPRWSPNQIRHSTGTALRRQYGIEAARLVLGHRRAEVTEIYAEQNLERAAEIMGEVG